jgi:hypothetical protein
MRKPVDEILQGRRLTNLPAAESYSRRRFLKQSAFGIVALSSARFLPSFGSEPELSAEIKGQLQFFSPKEYTIMEAVADRLIGRLNDAAPSASQVGVALRADKFLAGADPEIQGQFHQLLTVFNAPAFTFLFDFRFSSFVNMKPEDQDTYVEDWMTSVIGFRRTGFQALKRTSLSMFYTEPRSWKEIGFDGLDVPHQ